MVSTCMHAGPVRIKPSSGNQVRTVSAHLRSLEVIRGHQRSLEVIRYVPSRRTTTESSRSARCSVDATPSVAPGLRTARRAPSPQPYASHGMTLIRATLATLSSFLTRETAFQSRRNSNERGNQPDEGGNQPLESDDRSHLPVEAQLQIAITLEAVMHDAVLRAHLPVIVELEAILDGCALMREAISQMREAISHSRATIGRTFSGVILMGGNQTDERGNRSHLLRCDLDAAEHLARGERAQLRRLRLGCG